MRKYAAFFALLVVAFSSVVSLACEEPPLPLRGMYLESDIIVVGRIGKPGKWIAGARESESDYQIFNRSFPITVEKVLKGEAPSRLAVSEESYQYLGDGSTDNANTGAKPAAQPDSDTELSKDTGRRLFFLKKNEQGGYTEIYTNREFAPKGKDLDIFISRLGELGEMYHNGEPSKERIVEWLVSMTENPVTRFDGAYELRESLYDLRYQTENQADEQAAEPAENADHEHSLNDALLEQADAETAAAAAENSEGEEPYRSYGEAEFARLLTAEQKARLIKAFFTVKFDYEPKKNENAEDPDETYIRVLNEGDSHLVDAVVLMGDRRVINRILAELPNLARHESYTAASLLEIISGQLKNEKFTKLVGKFSEVAYGSEDEMIDAKTSAYDVESFEGTDEEKAAQLANLPSKTYGKRRAELVSQITASANQLVAKK